MSWKLWRRANELWCFKKSRMLKKNLGNWLYPSSQLRQEWPYHYRFSMDTVYKTTEDGYVPYMRYTTQDNIYKLDQLQPTEDTLPDDCYPIRGLPMCDGICILQTARLCARGKPAPSPPPVADFQDYVATLPEWEKDLLQHVTPTDDHETVLASVLKACSRK